MPSYYMIKLALEKILQKLDVIDVKVSQLPEVQVSVSNKHLATLITLKKLDNCATATQVSRVTGRQRAVESTHLNQLSRMGLVTKERRGHRIFYKLRDEYA